VADRSRHETAALRLVDRLRPVVGGSISLRVAGAGVLSGVLTAVGADWLLLADHGRREDLVASSAVLSIGGLAAQSAAPLSEGQVVARLTLAYALRGLVRDRAVVAVTLIDGSTATGTLDRTGADFVELAEHPAGEARRRDAVRAVRSYSLHALAVVARV
jgi:hypothetical protein